MENEIKKMLTEYFICDNDEELRLLSSVICDQIRIENPQNDIQTTRIIEGEVTDFMAKRRLI
jgi:hypothetical protein